MMEMRKRDRARLLKEALELMETTALGVTEEMMDELGGPRGAINRPADNQVTP